MLLLEWYAQPINIKGRCHLFNSTAPEIRRAVHILHREISCAGPIASDTRCGSVRWSVGSESKFMEDRFARGE